jgi:hypothetical protein
MRTRTRKLPSCRIGIRTSMILCKQLVIIFFVKYSQISDIIGEEEWVDGEMNILSNIGSHQIVNLSFGAKKKEKKDNIQSLLEDLSTHNKNAKKNGTEYSESNKSKDLLIVGDRVIVMNHGMK